MNEKAIKEKFKTNINENVVNITKLTNGSVNEIYKVTTENQTYVMRIFVQRHLPNVYNLKQVYNKLREANFRVPKNYYIAVNDQDFPNGYMIQEFITGDNIKDIIGRISLEEYFAKLARLIKQLHHIKLSSYGLLTEHHENSPDFIEHIKFKLERHCQELAEVGVYDNNKINTIKKLIIEKLSLCRDLEPVLCHGDIAPNNLMLSNEELILIDWDNAFASVWIEDYALMTFIMEQDISNHKLVEKYKNIFLNNYGTNLEHHQIKQVEQAFHLLQSIKILTYYKRTEKNKEYEKLYIYAENLINNLTTDSNSINT